nr:transposase [Klebsiella pneumoniae]
MTFADAEYAGKRKQTRKELFLIEMDRVVPWKGLIALIEPHYPKGEGGRPAYPLMAMLRVHLLQNWFGYSDPAMEEADDLRRRRVRWQAQANPQGVVPDRDGSGGAVEGLDCFDRATLSEG